MYFAKYIRSALENLSCEFGRLSYIFVLPMGKTVMMKYVSSGVLGWYQLFVWLME